MEVTEARLPCVQWSLALNRKNLTSHSPSLSLYGCTWHFTAYSANGKWGIDLHLDEKTVENVDFFIVPFLSNKNGEFKVLPCKFCKTEIQSQYIIEMDESEFSNYYEATGDDRSISFTFYFVSKQIPGEMPVANSLATQTATPSINKSCQQVFSEDIEKLFDNFKYSDAVLKCKDKRFAVNQNILSVRSDVFATVFRSEIPESQNGAVEITDVPPSVLEQFLRYIYSGKLDTLCMDTVFEMYRVSKKYEVLSLKEKCVSLMASNLSEDNFCEILLLAHTSSDTELFDSAISFVSNRQGFLKTATWEEFARKNTAVAVEVFLKTEAK